MLVSPSLHASNNMQWCCCVTRWTRAQLPPAALFGGAAAMPDARGAGGASEVGDDGLTGVQRDVAGIFKRPEAAGGQGVHNQEVQPHGLSTLCVRGLGKRGLLNLTKSRYIQMYVGCGVSSISVRLEATGGHGPTRRC